MGPDASVHNLSNSFAKVAQQSKKDAKNVQVSESGKLGAFFKLARPKFLFYSLAMHAIGALLSVQQTGGNRFDPVLFALVQATIWVTHVVRN